MPRLPTFDSPLLLGFEHFERLVDRISKTSAEGYPPYNIEQVCENEMRITLAVAGFSMDDLKVSVEDSQLVIRGVKKQEDDGRVYLHRGIASRQFQRAFVLAEGIEIQEAALDNGLLHINLVRQVPKPEVRKIEIRDGAPQTINVEPNR